MKVRKAEKDLADQLMREPTQEEIATQAGITPTKLHQLRKVGQGFTNKPIHVVVLAVLQPL